VGGHEIIRLGDGSTVELNTDTSLRVAVNSDRRIVWLDKGEAYFQIRHDPVRPFIVMAGNRRVTDLGTKFVVRREPNRLQVAVVEGRVWLDATAGKSQSALVSADQSAIATADAISVIRKPEAKLANRLGWRHGVLVFDNTTLAEAAAEFNRYNQRKLVVSDSVAAAQTIGGTFPKNDVHAFTRVTHEILGLHISNEGNEIFISRR
jgi:transmembrane sensor